MKIPSAKKFRPKRKKAKEVVQKQVIEEVKEKVEEIRKEKKEKKIKAQKEEANKPKIPLKVGDRVRIIERKSRRKHRFD